MNVVYDRASQIRIPPSRTASCGSFKLHFILQYYSIRLKQYPQRQPNKQPCHLKRVPVPFRTFPTTTFNERKKRSRDLVHVEHEPTKKRVKIHKKTTSIFDCVDPCIVTTSTLVFPFTDVVAAFIVGKQKRSNDDESSVTSFGSTTIRSSYCSSNNNNIIIIIIS